MEDDILNENDLVKVQLDYYNVMREYEEPILIQDKINIKIGFAAIDSEVLTYFDEKAEETIEKEILNQKLTNLLALAERNLQVSEKISSTVSEIKDNVVDLRYLFMKAFINYPLEMTKAISLLFFVGSISALILGKILNRIIIAPDIGILFVIFSIGLWFVSYFRSEDIKKRKLK